MAEASVAISEDLPVLVQPVVRILALLLLLIFTLLMMPWLFFRRIFPKKAEDAFLSARTELETCWYEESPEAALDRLRELRNKIEDQYDKVHWPGVKIEPYGTFKWYEYACVIDLLYHFETRIGNQHEASDLCDDFLRPYLENPSKRSPAPENWMVKKAKTIRALQGPLAAQEFLMPYVDNEKEDSHLREYFLELREKEE